MKIYRKIAFLASVLALALAPTLSAQTLPVTSVPLPTDVIGSTRQNSYGGETFPKFSLAQVAGLVDASLVPGSGIWSIVQNSTATGATINAGALFTIPGNLLGYAGGFGIGASVTQATNKATGVTLNAATGNIVTSNASLANATAVIFTFTNSFIGLGDTITWAIQSGTSAAYNVSTVAVTNGTASVAIYNESGGTLSEALTLNFVIVNGAAN